MPILGPLAGMTAAGLYAVVDEIRVGHRIRNYKPSGSLIATMDYKVESDTFNGVIQFFEDNWQLDAGSAYPPKLVGFFAENPAARQQWIRMQASIIMHDRMERLITETDTCQFGKESQKYDNEFGLAEREYIAKHWPEDEAKIVEVETQQRAEIQKMVEDDERRKKVGLVVVVISLLLLTIAVFTMKTFVWSGMGWITMLLTGAGGWGLLYFIADRIGFPAAPISSLVVTVAMMLFIQACN